MTLVEEPWDADETWAMIRPYLSIKEAFKLWRILNVYVNNIMISDVGHAMWEEEPELFWPIAVDIQGPIQGNIYLPWQPGYENASPIGHKLDRPNGD